MERLKGYEKLLAAVKNNDQKRFYKLYFSFGLILYAAMIVLKILFSFFLDFEAGEDIFYNSVIGLIIWIFTLGVSAYFEKLSCIEYIKFQDKENKKARWLSIISKALAMGILMPISTINYVDAGLGRIILKHLFILITFGLFTGYTFSNAVKTERLKEILGPDQNY